MVSPTATLAVARDRERHGLAAGDIAVRVANKRESEAKLIVSWMVGSRDAETANLFISHLKARLANRVQLTTDGWRAYLTIAMRSRCTSCGTTRFASTRRSG